MVSSAPPSPAMNADTTNAVIRARAGEIPIDWEATALPRSARRVWPTVPSRMRTTANETMTSSTTQSTRNVRSLLMSQGPRVGRGTRVPCRSDASPPPTHANFTITASKKYAKARVAMESQIPPNRSTGSDRTAPTAAATAAPMSIASRTDIPKWLTSWNTVKPPIAAKVPWHSEISPARPVMIVIERKIVDMMTAWVTRNVQDASPRKSTTDPVIAKNTTAKVRVASVSPWLRVVAARAGGGGSTPARGSDTSRLPRIAGQNTSTTNSTTKGIAGVTFSCTVFSHGKVSVQRGRNVCDVAISTPSPRPPTQRAREAHQPADGCRGDGDHHEAEEVAGVEGVEARCDEHARHPCEEARQRPGERGHPVRPDAVQFGHPRALHHRAHLQPDGGVAEHRRQAGHAHGGDARSPSARRGSGRRPRTGCRRPTPHRG